ncbi:unnamed protein product, partial [Hapterophycus canaliculatus]
GRHRPSRARSSCQGKKRPEAHPSNPDRNSPRPPPALLVGSLTPGYNCTNNNDQGMPDFILSVDKIQADPFAAPSRFHVVVPGAMAGFPAEAFSTKVRAARQDGADQKAGGGGWSGAKGGEITIDEPGQHILERSSVLVHEGDGSVEARFTVGMPARG